MNRRRRRSLVNLIGQPRRRIRIFEECLPARKSLSGCSCLIVSPQIAPISFGDEPVNAGDLVSVQCVVTKGDSPLEISWTFDSQPIRPDRMDVIVSNSGKRVKQLTIESVAARHAGEYTCVASNAAGSTSHSAKLDVNGTPLLGETSFPDLDPCTVLPETSHVPKRTPIDSF